LNEDVQEVMSVQLIYQDFEFNEYNVTNNNNKIYIKESDTTEQTISIEPGVYDANSLITELNSKLSSYAISVSYLETQRKYKFVAGATARTINVIRHHPEEASLDNYIQTLDSKKTDLRNSSRGTNEYINLSQEIDELNNKIRDINTFEKDYKEKSIYRVLGFAREDLVLSANEEKTLAYPVHLKPERFIAMYLQQAKNYNSPNNNLHQCFAIINGEKGQTYDQNIVKRFNPPIASYKILKFKFVDYYGNPYDFQNKDHRFELEIVCLKQTRMYGNIFT
jgi:hypothetical protein